MLEMDAVVEALAFKGFRHKDQPSVINELSEAPFFNTMFHWKLSNYSYLAKTATKRICETPINFTRWTGTRVTIITFLCSATFRWKFDSSIQPYVLKGTINVLSSDTFSWTFMISSAWVLQKFVISSSFLVRIVWTNSFQTSSYHCARNNVNSFYRWLSKQTCLLMPDESKKRTAHV